MNLGQQGWSGQNRRQQDVKQILTTHKSTPEDRANSLRARLLRTLTVRVRRFGRRIVRRLVILKDTRNLAKKALFLFVGIFSRVAARGPRGRPRLGTRWWGWKGLVPP